jgi:hypothetical protein
LFFFILIAASGPKSTAELETVLSFEAMNLKDELLRGIYAYGQFDIEILTNDPYFSFLLSFHPI